MTIERMEVWDDIINNNEKWNLWHEASGIENENISDAVFNARKEMKWKEICGM